MFESIFNPGVGYYLASWIESFDNFCADEIIDRLIINQHDLNRGNHNVSNRFMALRFNCLVEENFTVSANLDENFRDLFKVVGLVEKHIGS